MVGMDLCLTAITTEVEAVSLTRIMDQIIVVTVDLPADGPIQERGPACLAALARAEMHVARLREVNPVLDAAASVAVVHAEALAVEACEVAVVACVVVVAVDAIDNQY